MQEIEKQNNNIELKKYSSIWGLTPALITYAGKAAEEIYGIQIFDENSKNKKFEVFFTYKDYALNFIFILGLTLKTICA